MTGKELKGKFANISDNDDAFFAFTDSNGQVYQMKIRSALVKRCITMRDAVLAIQYYCLQRQGLLYSCNNCIFSEGGKCLVGDLMNMHVSDIPDIDIVVGDSE